jgi:hypothetical protein
MKISSSFFLMTVDILKQKNSIFLIYDFTIINKFKISISSFILNPISIEFFHVFDLDILKYSISF